MNKLLAYALCLSFLVVAISTKCAEETKLSGRFREVGITDEIIDLNRLEKKFIPVTNDTDSRIDLRIKSSNHNYEAWKKETTLLGARYYPLSSKREGVLIGYPPYTVELIIGSLRPVSSLKPVVFEVPEITPTTEILLTEIPQGSQHFEVWYRDTEQAKQEARALLGITHERLGKEAPQVSPFVSKKITKHILKDWRKAHPVH